jgi:hypothetical protein
VTKTINAPSLNHHKLFLSKMLQYSGKAATPRKRGIIQNYMDLIKKKATEDITYQISLP